MADLKVPFLNLQADQEALADELQEAVFPLLRSASFVGGPAVAAFEEEFAAVQEAAHAVSLKSGTAAIHLGLQALGVGPGDEVIVPAFTFIATAAPIVHLGAVPVFVDVDSQGACLDPSGAKKAISPRTKAIVAVHLYGQPAPMDAILEAAGDIPVLEDCAQSHLATYNGKMTGTIGALGTFSFYPSKNLGAAGDGGAVVTNDRELGQRIRRLANHGRTGHYEHGELGWNERMDAVQAAVLRVKLRHLPQWTQARRTAARTYDELLANASFLGQPLRTPAIRGECDSAYHLYVVRHPQRDALARHLEAAGVATGIHYPGILPHQPAFKSRGFDQGEFPNATEWTRECLALPLFPGISEAQQQFVAEVIRSPR